jgi:hypothetical protein
VSRRRGARHKRSPTRADSGRGRADQRTVASERSCKCD